MKTGVSAAAFSCSLPSNGEGVNQAGCWAALRAICEAGTSLVARPFTPANMASVNKAAKLNEVKEMRRVWVAVNMVDSGGLGVAMNEL